MSGKEEEAQEAEAKLEELRRKAKEGEEAYNRGGSYSIEDDAALTQFFRDIAREAAGT